MYDGRITVKALVYGWGITLFEEQKFPFPLLGPHLEILR